MRPYSSQAINGDVTNNDSASDNPPMSVMRYFGALDPEP
jgi:hypothetical protein